MLSPLSDPRRFFIQALCFRCLTSKSYSGTTSLHRSHLHYKCWTAFCKPFSVFFFSPVWTQQRGTRAERERSAAGPGRDSPSGAERGNSRCRRAAVAERMCGGSQPPLLAPSPPCLPLSRPSFLLPPSSPPAAVSAPCRLWVLKLGGWQQPRSARDEPPQPFSGSLSANCTQPGGGG